MSVWLDEQFGPEMPSPKYQELHRRLNNAMIDANRLQAKFLEVEKQNAARTAGQYGWQAADTMWRRRWEDLSGSLFIQLDEDAMRVVRREMEELEEK